MTLKEAIQRLADKEDLIGLIAEVVSVDDKKRSCEVKPVNGTANFTDVRLQASYELSEGFWVKPKIGSLVIVNLLDRENAYIVITEKIDSFSVKIGDQELNLDSKGITMNGGKLKGLVKVQDLTTKLNNLETKVNDLISTLKKVVIPLAPSGTYPLATDFATVTSLVKTKQSDLENTKIKQ